MGTRRPMSARPTSARYTNRSCRETPRAHPGAPSFRIAATIERIREVPEAAYVDALVADAERRMGVPVDWASRVEGAWLHFFWHRSPASPPQDVLEVVAGTDADDTLNGEEVLAALSEAGQIFPDPADGAWKTSDEYLSGNVRLKLDACRTDDTAGRFAVNIAALERVMPRQLEPAEITARLGAPWIPASASRPRRWRC